jgi:hypothetical protein
MYFLSSDEQNNTIPHQFEIVKSDMIIRERKLNEGHEITKLVLCDFAKYEIGRTKILFSRND